MFSKLISKIKKNKFTVLITVFVVGLIGITLGSAIINSVLTLSGTTKIKESRWLIHFDFVHNISASNPNQSSASDARITDTKKENIAFNTTFKNVGDYYEFNVYTWNEGTIDAMIESYELQMPSAYKNNIRYSIHYDDEDIKPTDTIQISENKTKNLYDSRYDYSRTIIKPCDPLYKDTMRKVIVRVEYVDEIENLEDDVNINFLFKINYSQYGSCSCEDEESCNPTEENLLRIRPNGGVYNGKTTETKIYLAKGEQYTLKTPTRDLYNFTGWNIISPESGTYTFENNTITMGDENIIVEASWRQGDYVARIMNTYYPTIQDAFDAVDSKNWNDNTVWLLKDTTEYPTNNATHEFKFNLNKHTVTGTITNSAGSTITLMNGKVRAESPLTEEELEGLPLNQQHKAAVVNNGTVKVGIQDGTVNVENSIALIGNDYGLINNNKFEFYDGYLEGTAGFDGPINKVEPEYGILSEQIDGDRQRVYLTPTPKRSVAKIFLYADNNQRIPFYFYNLQDAFIDSDTRRKEDTNHNTDNDYIVYAIRDFEAAYSVEVASDERILFDLAGFEISTGENVTNNGYLKIYNSDSNRSTIAASVSITNNSNLIINNVSISSSTDDNTITNKGNLTLTKATITGGTGYGINNINNGRINADENTIIKSNSNYGLNNSANGLTISDATIYGLKNSATMTIDGDVKVKSTNSTYAILNSGTLTMNNGTISENLLDKQAIENTGTFNVAGGEIYNKTIAIRNSGTVNVTGGRVSSDNDTINNGAVNVRGGEVFSSDGNAIGATTVNVYGGKVESTNNDAITGRTVNVYDGTVTSENAKGINTSGIDCYVTVEGGNVHGHTYGIYGHEVSITGGKVTGDDIGVYAYLYTSGNREYPGSAGMTGGEIEAQTTGVVADYYEMSEGTITSDTGVGLTVKRSATVTGGTIIGETYGILNKGTLVLGNDEGTISVTEPLVIGKSYGLVTEEGATTNFYDGILKGQIDGYLGEISGTPLGAIVTDGTDTIDEVNYNTDYLIIYKNWLRVGTHEFNTINAASDYAQDGDTIEVFDEVDDITFKQEFISGSKRVTFDLAGFELKLTQPIYNSGENVTIIDSSNGHTGSIKGIKNTALINNRNAGLTIKSGNYSSSVKYMIDNMGLLTIDGGIFNTNETVVLNKDRLVIESGEVRTSKIAVENSANLKDNRTDVIYSYGTIEMNGGLINSSDTCITTISEYASNITINGGKLKGTNRGIYVRTGTVTVNGGEIEAQHEYAIRDYDSGIIINDGTITSKEGIAIYMAGSLEVNGGEIQGETHGVYTEQYCNAWAGSCGYPPITVNDGHIEGKNNDGIHSLGGNVNIYGGLVEGKNDGVYADGTTTIGTDEGSISKTTPVLIGHTNYGLEVTGYTAFYDGILKGIQDGYSGLISIIPTGSVIIEDFEYINRVKYETRYLDTKDNWLQIGNDESRQYNSLNAAVAAMNSTDTTIKVIASAYVDFAQTVPAGKNIIFDLNGHTVVLTQPIVFENETTIIDSGENGYLNNIRDVVINSTGKLTINDGKFNSETSAAIISSGTLIVNDGTITAQTSGNAIRTSGIATINGGEMKSTSGNGISNSGTLTINDGKIESQTSIAINNSGTTTIENGIITGSYGISSDATLTINNGTITATNGNGIQSSGTTIINDGTITATGSAAVRNIYNGVTINGGTITSLSSNAISNEGTWYRRAELEINGGTITGATNGLYNNTSEGNYNIVRITGGDIVGQNGTGATLNCTSTILGGTITGSTYGVYTSGTTTLGDDDGTLNIDTPILKGETYGLYIYSGTLYFYDGILKGITERTNDYEMITRIPDRSEIVYDTEEIDNKTYKTAYLYEETDIVQNLRTGTIYNNLQSAFSAAADDDTLKMLNNASIYYDVVNNKNNITLDLNGKKITTTMNIQSNGKLTITDSTGSRGTIKTSASKNLIVSSSELVLGKINLTNNSTSKYVVSSSGKVTLNDTQINSREGIYSSSEIEANNALVYTSGTALNTDGSLTIVGGTYTGVSYSIYTNTRVANSTIDIDNATLVGNVYISGNNTSVMKNSTLHNSLQNYSNLTIERGTKATLVNNGITNGGTLTATGITVVNGMTNSGTFVGNEITVTSGRIINSGTLTLNDSSYNTHINGGNAGNYTYGIYNSRTATLNNTNVTVTTDGYLYAISNSGTLNVNEGTEINVSGGRIISAIAATDSGTVNINDVDISVSGSTTGYGVITTGENAKIIMRDGRIEATNCGTSYGAYANYGIFEMGVYDGSGAETAEVSLTNPYVYASGTTGIGVKKTNGAFNFYDGIIWGSKYSKPDTTSNVEKNWEATTYIDENNGYEYTILEYMPHDYEDAEVAILKGVYYRSIALALARAENGDTIKILRSTTEDINIPAGLNVIINLNKNTVTGQVTNNGTLNVYNGTLNNFDDTTVVNNGTFIMGEDDNSISGANVRIVSEKTAVDNNGTFAMYDGYIEGNPSIDGIVDTIPPLSRIRTTNTGQSERKTLQSLSRESIIAEETDLILTIDPNSGKYDEISDIQEVYLKYRHSYNLLENHTITKNGCEFDGWEVSDPTAYNDGVITVEFSDITVRAKWRVSEDAVAQVGSEYYTSVADAIFHAKKGDKVILLKDTTEDVTNDKDIVIDLGGNTLTGAFINNGNLRIDNGTILNPEEDGIAIINKKKLSLGNLADAVSPSRVIVKGNSVGLQNDGEFNFYDGYILGTIALNGVVDSTPQGYYVYNKSVEEDETVYQKVYLEGDPENAVAETRVGGTQYFFNLNDAIATSKITGYEIYLRKNLDAPYEIKVPEGANIVLNLEGHNISTGNPITNNGTLKIYDTEDDKGIISIGNTITNNGTLLIDEIHVIETNTTANLFESSGSLTINNTIIEAKNNSSTTSGNVITSSGPLTIKNSTITAEGGYAVYSTGTLNLVGDNELNSNVYALYNAGNELTLNTNVIKGIETTKDITVEDGATIIGNGDNGSLVGRDTCDIVINGGTITTQNIAVISSGSNSTITVNGGNISGGSVGLYCSGLDNTITVNGGTMEGSYHAVWLYSPRCNYVMNGGSVIGTHFGLVDGSSNNTITINDGLLSGEETDGIIENVSRSTNAAYPNVYIKGGTVVGGRYGVYNQYAKIHVSGGEVKSENNYAVYNTSVGEVYITEDGYVNAPNTSAIYNNYKVEMNGGRIYSGGQYGVYNNATLFTMTDGLIETPGQSSYGVRLNGNNQLSGGEVISGNVGLLFDTNYTINISGDFKVKGSSYGIYQTNNGTINVGNSSETLSTTSPYISGGLYGIYKTNGTVNFYNGKLRGRNNGYNGSITDLRKNMDIYTTYEHFDTDDQIKTYNTTNVSANAESNQAKSGNGHARITYIGETTDTCTNGDVTNIYYSGHEETFTPTCAGEYQLEVWGASGGSYNSTYHGGYGGYATGTITLSTTETLYINVGGQGNNGTSTNIITGGYNGGGNGNYHGGAGGGATHIATKTGLLSALENDVNKILIVAGGGGGGAYTNNWNASAGGSGGGYIGGDASENAIYNDTVVGNGYGTGGTQTKGGSTNVSTGSQGTFGQGGSYVPGSTSYGSGGGGGGFYGGGGSTLAGAGGGSGYIANERLSDAYMYGYNVEPTEYIINYLVPKEGYLRVGQEMFNNFEDAFEAVGTSGTIYLTRSVSLTEEVTFPADTTITFNLQGNTLSMTKKFINNSNLTVTSTGSDTKGKIYTNGDVSFNLFNNTTFEDVIIQNVSNSALQNSSNNTLNINGTTEIIGAYAAITNGGAATININSGTVSSTSDYGIYINTNGVTINMNGGTINSNSYGIFNNSKSGVNTTINDGTINSGYGIYINGPSNTTTINGGTINGTTAAIYNNNTNSTMSTLRITGGTLTGKTAVYVKNTNATVTNGTLTGTGTANSDYAFQVSTGTATITGGEYTSSGSGINVTGGTIKDITINSSGSNGSGIVASGTLLLDNVTVNTTGSSSYGLSGNPTLTFENSTINSSNIGMNITGNETTIVSGSIKGENNGIVIDGSGATVNMGLTSQELSIEKPYVTGGNYAINNTNGVFNFYNGRLRGKVFGYNGTLNSIRKGKQVYTEYEADFTIPGATLSTDKVSEEPTSKYAKIGDGHARITYIGETNETCEYGDFTDISYTGSEETFNVPCTGKYKLEVWGAQGGNINNNNYIGGYGGYSTGKINLDSSDTLYINVGGQGVSSNSPGGDVLVSGGYNGGGTGYQHHSDVYGAGGGGATHIATSSGLLSSLEDNKSSIIIVAGGGAGAYKNNNGQFNGASGGGYIGGYKTNYSSFQATQDSGYSFGQAGDTDTTYNHSGGGGGYYGGYGRWDGIASGGSGYTEHVDLEEAVMCGYFVESTDAYVINYLVSKDGFLEVDDEVYSSFEAAFAAITGDTGTITVLNSNSVQEEVTFPSGKTITLDLNGKTLNMTQPIINTGTLYVVDNSNTNKGKIANSVTHTIRNQGTLVLDNVTLDNTGTNVATLWANSGTGSITLRNNAKVIGVDGAICIDVNHALNIESGNIKATNGYGVVSNVDNASISISNATFETKTYGVYLKKASNTVEISDTSFTTSDAAIYNTGANNNISLDNVEITANNNGSGFNSSGTGAVINIKDSNISGYRSLYIAATSNNITIDNSELSATSSDGVYLNTDSTTLTVTDSTINGITCGLKIYGQSSKITLTNTDVVATSGIGINDDKIKPTNYNRLYFNDIYVTGGSITGSTHGMYSRYNRIHISGTELKTTSNNVGHYALYTDGSQETDISGNAVLNAPNASGLYASAGFSIADMTINAGGINAAGIKVNWLSGNLANCEINVPNGNGIETNSNPYLGFNFINSSIDAGNIGLAFKDSSSQTRNINIISGSIKGKNYGIYQTQDYTLKIGDSSEPNSTKDPYIEGGIYGLYKSSGTLNFYSGRIKGFTAAYSGTINSIRSGYELYETDDELTMKEESIRTVSTTNVSATPESNQAKMNDGHARITYVGDDTTIKLINEYENPVDCEDLLNKKYDFKSILTEQTMVTKCAGTYKLEVWGAQGGTISTTYKGGYGGYSTGTVELSKNQKLYINVGSAGYAGTTNYYGGYNGGGAGTGSTGCGTRYGASGGGATHIATSSGILSSLSNKKSSVIIVAGGGGGAQQMGSANGSGAAAGGYIGNTANWTNSGHRYYVQPTGGTQEAGGSRGYSYAPTSTVSSAGFGKGASFVTTDNCTSGSGGGSGWYGGGDGQFTPGAGGSGYIGYNTLDNKSMYCYDCQTSNEESTKTISTTGSDESLDLVNCPNGYSSTPTSKCAKEGSGYARITLIELDSSENKATVNFISEKGTIQNNSKEITKGSAIGTLETPTTTGNIVFDGWYLDSNYTTRIDSTYIVEKSMNVYAKYTLGASSSCSTTPGTVYDSYYSNGEDTYITPCTGTYRLEVWGGQGGSANSYTGGYGGYSSGYIKLNAAQTLYINVGGAGTSTSSTNRVITGGYNGGGGASFGSDGMHFTASGGGATHIATTSGLLSTLENNKNSILIVAGGGGGAYYHTAGYYGNGGSGGGYTGASGQGNRIKPPTGGTQTGSGVGSYLGGFGFGGTGMNGGGGGYYGGGSAAGGTADYGISGAGGGSGYIGNNNLYDKVMYGYSVPSIYESNPSKVVYLVKEGEYLENTTTHETYSSLETALDEANENETIMLTRNGINNVEFTTDADGVTIDLNGYTLNMMQHFTNTGDITITNNKANSTSSITSTLSTWLISNSGTLHVSNISVSGTQFVANNVPGNSYYDHVTFDTTGPAIVNSGAITLNDCNITAPTGISNNNANSTMVMDNTTITSSNQAITNIGTMTITDSIISGTSYAIYENGTKESTITGSTLSSASTALYNYSTGKLIVNTTDITGKISNTKTNGTINITGDTENKNTITGTVSNTGNSTIKNMIIEYTSSSGNMESLVSNSGIMILTNSKLDFKNTYSSYTVNDSRGIINSGTLTSSYNNYIVRNTNNRKHIIGIHNIGSGIINSNNDTVNVSNGKDIYAIYSAETSSATYDNISITADGASENIYGVQVNSGLVNISNSDITIRNSTTVYGLRVYKANSTINVNDKVNVNISNSTNSYGIYQDNGTCNINNPLGKFTINGNSIARGIYLANGTNTIRGGAFEVQSNTSAYGAEIASGTFNMISGNMKVTAPTAYGVKASAGTVVLGEYDSVNTTNEADLSTTNPHIEAIGTTSGIGVSLGNARFEYYDGIIIGSTSARVAGEYIHATQDDFIPDTHDYYEAGVRLYEYCILKYSR